MRSLSVSDRLALGVLPGQVVTLYDAEIELGDKWQQAARALSELVRRGVFARLCDAVWVRLGKPPDPYRVGARITSPYAFAFGAALALHSRLPDPPSDIAISSLEPFQTFEHAGVTYRHVQPWVADDVVWVRPRGPRSWLAVAARGVLAAQGAPLNGAEKREGVFATGIERTLRECAEDIVDGLGVKELLALSREHPSYPDAPALHAASSLPLAPANVTATPTGGTA